MAKQDFLEKLADLRNAHCDEIPTPEMAVMTRATARLRRSGIMHQLLQIGETAPDFTFIDSRNNHTSLYALLKDGPVIINFFRGFWCMYCKTELEAYSSIKEELEELGCYYLAISPQDLQNDELSESHYQTVYDRNNQIARLFNIVYELGEDEIDLFKSWDLRVDQINDSGNWTLPIPATYLISQDRTVAYQFADVDIRSRCCPDDLLEELKRLK